MRSATEKSPFGRRQPVALRDTGWYLRLQVQRKAAIRCIGQVGLVRADNVAVQRIIHQQEDIIIHSQRPEAVWMQGRDLVFCQRDGVTMCAIQAVVITIPQGKEVDRFYLGKRTEFDSAGRLRD